MIIRTRAVLPCSLEIAWDALHNPTVFRYASSPLTSFRESGKPLPERFVAGVEYGVSVWGGGLVPMGHQIIHLIEGVSPEGHKTLTDVGRGTSGMLALLHHWKHEMALSERSDGDTDFRDTLSVQAGALTPLLWPAMRALWWWRGYRLSQKLGHLAKRSDGSER